MENVNAKSRNNKRIIVVPDGYNGHTIKMYASPVAEDSQMVKLGCAEPGREYQAGWVPRELWEELVGEK